MCLSTHARTQTCAHKRTRTHARTHTHKLCLKPRTSVLRVHIASTHPSWSASPNQSLEVQAQIKYPNAHSVCSTFGVYISACSGPQKLPQYISRQPARQEMCRVMADDSSEIADSSPSSYIINLSTVHILYVNLFTSLACHIVFS